MSSSNTEYLNLDVIDPLCGPKNWSTNHRWECMQWKIGCRITTLYKLKIRKKNKIQKIKLNHQIESTNLHQFRCRKQ